jgi:hypothetical protein
MTVPAMSSTDRALLKNRIVGILRSHAVQSINFVAAAVHINHSLYSELASLVLSDKVHLGVDPNMTIEFFGEYHAPSDSLTLRKASIGTLSEESKVVHELTHAAVDLLDLPKTRGLHRTEIEAISYIAQRVYSRLLHADPAQKQWPRLAHVADGIAAKVVATRPHLYHVSESEIVSLRNAIGQHRSYHLYRGDPAPSDGIPTREHSGRM